MVKNKAFMSILMALLMIFTFPVGPNTTSSATVKNKIKSFTVYTNAIKEGNTVYCCGSDIYKVNLKNGKVIILKKNNDWQDSTFTDMKKIGSWIYFRKEGEAFNKIYRVNVKNRKCELIGPKKFPVRFCYIGNSWYIISGSKIYFSSIYDGEYDGYFNTVAKINGKGEKRSNVAVKKYMKRKKNNKNGYRVITKWDGGENYITLQLWLKTPKKKYQLANKRHIY